MILEEIPLLAGAPDQIVSVTLADTTYTVRMLWNERFGYWSLSLFDDYGDALVTNIKCVNNYPLVSRYQKTTFAGDLYFIHRSGKTYRPTFDDVGNNTYGIFYYDPEEVIDHPAPLSAVGYLSSIWDAGMTQWDVVDDVGTSTWI